MKMIAFVMAVMISATLALGGVAFAQQPVQGTQPQFQGMGRCMGGPGFGFGFGRTGLSMLDVTAQVSGIDRFAVMTELRSGKTFAQIAEAHGKSADDLKNALMEGRKNVMAQAVSQGFISQADADLAMTRMQANLEQCVAANAMGGFGPGMGRGMGGGMGRGMGRGGMGGWRR
jgi:hypothetical protein